MSSLAELPGSESVSSLDIAAAPTQPVLPKTMVKQWGAPGAAGCLSLRACGERSWSEQHKSTLNGRYAVEQCANRCARSEGKRHEGWQRKENRGEGSGEHLQTQQHRATARHEAFCGPGRPAQACRLTVYDHKAPSSRLKIPNWTGQMDYHGATLFSNRAPQPETLRAAYLHP